MRDAASREEQATIRPLIPLYLCVMLYAAGESALHLLVPLYLDVRLDQGSVAIGGIVAAFGIASLVARLPVGASYRSHRALRLLVVGGLLCSAAFAAVPLVGGPMGFTALMALDGVGWALVTTTQLALLVAARPSGLRTVAAMAWYAGFQGAGNSLGGVTAGWLGDQLGLSMAFVVLASLPVLATVIMLVAGSRAGIAGATVAPAVPRSRFGPRQLATAVITMPAVVWSGVLIMIYINVVNGFVNTFHPVLALAAGLTLTEIGTLSTCRSVASSSIRLASGPLFSRRGSGRSLATPLVLLSAAAVLLVPVVVGSFSWQVPLFLAIGMSRGLLRITGSALAFEGGPSDERSHGLIAALVQGGLDLGRVAGPVVGGLVAGLLGLPAAFRVMPLVLLAAYTVLQVMTRRAVREPVGG